MEIAVHAKLYQYYACPFSWKVRALLQYKQIPFEVVEVHPLNKKEIQFSKDYKKVPIFVDSNGKQVNDSTQIMRYIDEHYPQHRVFQTETPYKEKEEEYLLFSQELVSALPPVIYQTWASSWDAFAYISRVSKFSWWQKGLIRLAGTAVMHMVARKKAQSKGITDPEAHFKSKLEELQEHLTHKYLLHDTQVCAADLAIWGILRSIEDLEVFSVLNQFPKLLQWYRTVGDHILPPVHPAV